MARLGCKGNQTAMGEDVCTCNKSILVRDRDGIKVFDNKVDFW